ENARAAFAVGRLLGIDDEAVARGLESVRGVPGRFESVDEGQPFEVVVDYSHKPDALESVLRTARELATGRVLCVFGCGGDRDRGKRPLMGRIASELADVAILTSDNPRSEDPLAIIEEVLGGVSGAIEVEPDGAAATLVPDDAFAATAAIGRAVRDRSNATVVGITGSTGKTSTKDILAALCRPVARTVAAEAGHNNELGLPLTLARIEPETEVVITEMGMRGLGQIRELCEIARPKIAVVTGVGPVHLELLGTVERVAQAKAEILCALPPDGV